MSDRSITISTVTASPIEDCGRMLTPRLQLVVNYTMGGTSCLTGNQYSRGYEIAVRHDLLSDEGWVSLIIDGKGNPTALIEQAARYSAKTLDKIFNEVRNGKHNELIARLYEKAKANRPKYAWPASIWPQADIIPSDGFADGGEPYTAEEMQLS